MAAAGRIFNVLAGFSDVAHRVFYGRQGADS
jgi:hypothetical protein